MSSNGRAPIRVLLVEDLDDAREHERVLGGDAAIELVGRADHGSAAVEMVARLQPDVAVVGEGVAGCAGTLAADLIRDSSPGTEVLVLIDPDPDADPDPEAARALRSALQAGCSRWLPRDVSGGELVAAIAALRAAGSTAGRGDRTTPLVMTGRRGGPAHLTAREVEVLRLMAMGSVNKDIARTLHVSVNTVRNHVRNLMLKLGVHSKLEAASLAWRQGVVRPDDPAG